MFNNASRSIRINRVNVEHTEDVCQKPDQQGGISRLRCIAVKRARVLYLAKDKVKGSLLHELHTIPLVRVAYR